ncbi:MAG: SAM-dependent methyltransferase [Gammaproteobacteria bacterium HGW-Gammaproteobacteria-3]|jgi:ubiquinone/menaquinone biosynthesis C-methylase UbiE|nr:MAG: SAM-dependent methyltransferase [Gammaproteobacteria bacterium HGW-Gammaproteobacteria-3]
MTDAKERFDAMFSGIIGLDYDQLQLICPAATQMSRRVGLAVGCYPKPSERTLNVVELGGGTGITTLALLTSGQKLSITSIDNEPTMQNQAKKHLRTWVDNKQLTFCANDALTALKDRQTDSVDIVASTYTIHNFENSYRADVIKEIFRVLKPGGQFINGDRYGLDDITAHTRLVQNEISDYFKVLIRDNKPDLLEHWIIHLFNDESQNHVMRETASLQQLEEAGFQNIALSRYIAVNALVTASKPPPV